MRFSDDIKEELPIKSFPGVGFTPWGDMLMPGDFESLIMMLKSIKEQSEGVILFGFVRDIIGAFEFDADGEVITVIFAVPCGITGVPSAFMAWDILKEHSVSVDKEVSGDFEVFEGLKRGMGVTVEHSTKEIGDIIIPEFPFWE